MFDRPGVWPLLLGWLGCSSHSSSDFILAVLVSWLCGFSFGIFVTGLFFSRAARNILWGCLGSCVREFSPSAPVSAGGQRLARYRGHAHEQ